MPFTTKGSLYFAKSGSTFWMMLSQQQKYVLEIPVGQIARNVYEYRIILNLICLYLPKNLISMTNTDIWDPYFVINVPGNECSKIRQCYVRTSELPPNFVSPLMISNTFPLIRRCGAVLSPQISSYHRSTRVELRSCVPEAGPRLNIKTVLSTYGDFHVKDKTAVRTSYL